MARITCTTYWTYAINKEMKIVAVVFNILQEDSRAPVEYQMIRCHIVLEIKIHVTRKAMK